MKVHFAETSYYDENYNNILYIRVKPNYQDMVLLLKEKIPGIKWKADEYSKLNEKQARIFHRLIKENEYTVIDDNMRVLKDGSITR